MEQAQLKLHEADSLLARLLAKFNAAESRLVRIRVERWSIETNLAQLCAECVEPNSNLLGEAWKKKYAVETRLEQALRYRDAAQVQLKIKSVQNSLASQLRVLC